MDRALERLKRIVAEQWGWWEQEAADFQQEQAERITLPAAEHLTTVMQEFEQNHANSDRIDVHSPLDRLILLLSLLVECGNDWTPQKQASARRIVTAYAQQAVSTADQTKYDTITQISNTLSGSGDEDNLAPAEQAVVDQLFSQLDVATPILQ